MERYRIHILGLSINIHRFQFEVGHEFFKKYGTGLVSDGNFNVDLTLDKRETFLEATFAIKGSTKLICDRSLDEFDFQIDKSAKLIFKFGDEDVEISEDVVMIHRGTETLEIGQYIYEFIALAVPMKKLHPRFKEENNDDSDEEVKLIYKSEATDEATDDQTDPRWDILKKLNKN
jgi:uncharacterized metal-binding protein YceD (DUF177 family)